MGAGGQVLWKRPAVRGCTGAAAAHALLHAFSRRQLLSSAALIEPMYDEHTAYANATLLYGQILSQSCSSVSLTL